MTHTRTTLVGLGLILFVACESAPQKASEQTPPQPVVSAAQTTPPAEPEPEPEPAPEKPPDAVAAQHVLISYRGAKNAPKSVLRSKASAKKLAQDVADKARAGSDFTQLVKDYSEDEGTKDRLGSVGKFTPDKMVKPFSEAAFRLKVDEVSDVVETEFGFHVIKRNQ